MSHLSTEAASACRILDWSLHLRYRERAAIKIPLSNIDLPNKPVYNYTWEESNTRMHDDYRVNQMLLEGGDVSSLFETVVNPHEAELNNYQRQLEEYVKAVSSADKWIIREDEVNFFEAVQSMPHSIEVVEGVQQAIVSFGIAVPAVKFPEAASRQPVWFADEDVTEKIMYNDETDMTYIAKVHLANGSMVEVNGGRTKFFTPGRNESISFKTTEVPLLQKKPSRGCGEAFYCAADESVEHVLTDKIIKDDEQPAKQLSAIIEAPTRLIRGRKVTIKGRISSEEYIPTRIWIDTYTERERVWAHDQIAKARSVTSRNETYLITNIGLSSWRSSEQKQDQSSALYLEEQLQRHLDDFNDDDNTRSDDFGGSWCHRRSDKGLAIKSTDHGSFELEYTPSGDSFGSGSTFFAEHKAAFTIKVEARSLSEQEDAETQEGDRASEEVLSIHKKSHHDTPGWTEYTDHIRPFGRSSRKLKGVLTFEGKVPIEGFLNDMITSKKRNPILASLLDSKATDCKSKIPPLDYLEEGALAPRFVDISDQDKIGKAVSLVDSCAQLSQSFLAVNTAPTSLEHIPASIREHLTTQAKQSKVDVKYRKTKYPLPGTFDRDQCWEKPGSCGGARQDVGTVWVNQVMLPRLKLEGNAKDNRAGIKPTFLVMQS